MKQRIILTIPNAVFSGSERQLLILGNGLKNYGYDVFFCVLGGKGKIEDEIKNLSLKYFIYSDVKSYFKKLTFYIKIIKQVNPDVIISYNWAANNYTRIAKIVTLSCKFIHIAGERGRGMKDEKIKNLIDRFLHKKSDRIISNSFSQKEELIKHEKIKPQKIDVIYNGLRLNEEPSSGIGDVRNKFLKGQFQRLFALLQIFQIIKTFL